MGKWLNQGSNSIAMSVEQKAMRVTGLMTKCTEVAGMNTDQELSIRASGRRVRCAALVRWRTRTGPATWDSGLRTRWTVMEYTWMHKKSSGRGSLSITSMRARFRKYSRQRKNRKIGAHRSKLRSFSGSLNTSSCMAEVTRRPSRTTCRHFLAQLKILGTMSLSSTASSKTEHLISGMTC